MQPCFMPLVTGISEFVCEHFDYLEGALVYLLTDGDKIERNIQTRHHFPYDCMGDRSKGILQVQPDHSDFFCRLLLSSKMLLRMKKCSMHPSKGESLSGRGDNSLGFCHDASFFASIAT